MVGFVLDFLSTKPWCDPGLTHGRDAGHFTACSVKESVSLNNLGEKM